MSAVACCVECRKELSESDLIESRKKGQLVCCGASLVVRQIERLRQDRKEQPSA